MRCQLAVFSAYRADQYSDPDSFKISLGAVLEQYPNEVITYVCDPRAGIQRRSKWPPTISEMVEACDDHREFLARQRAPRPSFSERKPPPLLQAWPQGCMAQVFVPEGHARYASLCERAENSNPIWWKYGKASDGRQGIWVSHHFWAGLPDSQL